MKTNLTESMVASLEIDELCLRLGDHSDEVVRWFVARVESEFASFDTEIAGKDEEISNAWEEADQRDTQISILKEEIEELQKKLEAKS